MNVFPVIEARHTHALGSPFKKEMLMQKLTIRILTLLAVLQVGTTCLAEQNLTVMTHDSFNVSKKVISAFERTHQARVIFLKSGDAGAALVQAILAKDAPMADVFFGVDNTFFSRALKADIFIPYASPLLAGIADHFRLDPTNRLVPVTYGDVCLNYDRQWFTKKGLPPPTVLEDLVKPAYKGLTVVENPATSSPGLAFLLATIGHFGETGLSRFLERDAGKRCPRRQRLGRRLLRPLHRRLERGPTDCRQLRLKPRGGRPLTVRHRLPRPRPPPWSTTVPPSGRSNLPAS